MERELTKSTFDSIVEIHNQMFESKFLKKAMYTNNGIIIQIKNATDESYRKALEEFCGLETVEYEDEEGNIVTQQVELDILTRDEIDGKYSYFEKDNCCFVNCPGGEEIIIAQDLSNIYWAFNKIYTELFNDTIVLFEEVIDFGAYSILHNPEYSFKPNIFQRMKGAKTELGLLDQLKVRYKQKDSNITFKYNNLQIIM